MSALCAHFSRGAREMWASRAMVLPSRLLVKSLRLPSVRPVISCEASVAAEFKNQKSFRASPLFAFPPISTDRAPVNKRDAVDLDLLQMMQMAGDYDFYVCIGFSKN